MGTAISQITNGVHFLGPELVLVLAVCVMFITGPFLVTEGGVAAPGLRKRWGALALAAIGVLAGSLLLTVLGMHTVRMLHA